MWVLSQKSRSVYETLHEDLRKTIDEALKYSPIDFGLCEGYRSPERQFELFKEGRVLVDGEWKIQDATEVLTFKDGYNKLSKHNYSPSLAFDFFAWIPGKKSLMYNPHHMTALGIIFVTIGNILYEKGIILHKVRWGGNFNMNQEIVTDETFVDMPHIELVKP